MKYPWSIPIAHTYQEALDYYFDVAAFHKEVCYDCDEFMTCHMRDGYENDCPIIMDDFGEWYYHGHEKRNGE